MIPGLVNQPGAQASIKLISGAVSNLADKYCGRNFWIRPYTEQHKARGQVVIIPLQQPVQSITSLTLISGGFNLALSPVQTDVNGAPINSVMGYSTNVIDNITTIYLAGGMRVWDSITPGLYLAYTAGYASMTAGTNGGPVYSDLPQDFYEALCYEVATRYKELARLGSKSEVSGPGQSMVFNTGALQAQTKAALDRFKRTWYQLA